MKEILIFGSGEHSKVVFTEIIKMKNYHVKGFIDEEKKIGTVIESFKNKKYRVLSNIKNLNQILKKNTLGFIGIGSNYKRKKIVKEINKKYKNFKWATIISKNSVISTNVKIGEGTLIVSGSVINTGTTIGEHCLINTSSSIDHNNIFKNFSSTGPGVLTAGNVELGSCSHIGLGATINSRVKIGDNTIIGAKSLVLKNCKKNSVYFGLPSKIIKSRKINSNYL